MIYIIQLHRLYSDINLIINNLLKNRIYNLVNIHYEEYLEK